MILDLVGAGQQHATADVLVVGGGTVGLFIATELAAQGKRVLCIESGGRQQDGDVHPLNQVVQTGHPYAGAELGRARCLGGTSTLWGGALIPFQGADMQHDKWPIQWEDLAPHVPKVEALFGLPAGSYDAPLLNLSEHFVARLAKWPAFAKRNVYSLLKDKVDAPNGPAVWINATATRFSVAGATVKQVLAQAPDGSTLTIKAQQVVLAAGAIESTRLLLLLEQQNPGSCTGCHLGEGFHDHLSAVVADLYDVDRRALNHIVGFQFSANGGMRNLRYELAPESPLRQSLPACFAHIGFTDTHGPFAALRSVYRALQRRNLPNIEVWLSLAKGTPWLLQAAWWRYAKKRLLFPQDVGLQLHMVIEQTINNASSIRLSKTEKDQYENAKIEVNWQISPADVEAIQIATERFAAAWAHSQNASIAKMRLRTRDEVASSTKEGGGIYHPGGTTRVADSPSKGVLAPDLAVYGLNNLAVCSTAALPTGGGANPTKTMFLLAARLLIRLS